MTQVIRASDAEMAAYFDMERRRQEGLRRHARKVDPTPGHLAQRIDPLSVQTPALDLIDAELVKVRDGLTVMFARRKRFAELTRGGMDVAEATERAAAEIESDGIDRLWISMPPQEGKSTRVTRTFVLWLLRQFPSIRIGIISYDGGLAGQFSFHIRADVEFNNGEAGDIDLGLRLAKNQKAVTRWMLTSGATVYAVGIGGGLSGRPFDLILIDDPVKDVKAADSLIMSASAWVWWQTVARPRLAPWAPAVGVATRWHENDMEGRMISKQREDEAAGLEDYDRWTVINIPAQADHDPNKGEVDILGREPGEYMASARGRTRAQWEATKAATAPRYWTSLFQGRPAPDIGEIWLRPWWRRYDTPLWTQMADGTFRVNGYDLTQSWDCAFKDTAESDYVVGQVWAKQGADSFLVYELWARLSFTDTITAIRRVTRLFPQARRKIIEAKANGDAVIDSLKHEIPGIVEAHPSTSKTARATAVSPFVQAGNVHLPTSACAVMHPEIAWDPEAFIVEATSFPNAANDDQVDAASQYLQVAYLIGGETTISTPEGRLPGRIGSGASEKLSPIQQRLADATRRR